MNFFPLNQHTFYKQCAISAAMLFFILKWSYAAVPGAKINAITQINIGKDPYRIHIVLEAKPHYRIVKIDKREVMVAFKGVAISENIRRTGSGDPLITNLSLERTQGNVTTLMIKTQSDLEDVRSLWKNSQRTLIVSFIRKTGSGGRERIIRSAGKREVPIKTRSKNLMPKKKNRKGIKTDSSSAGRTRSVDQKMLELNETIKPKHIMPLEGSISKKEITKTIQRKKMKKDAFIGGIDDLILVMEDDPCVKSELLNPIFLDCKRKLWNAPYVKLENIIINNMTEDCLDVIYFLKAYCYYKINEKQKGGGGDLEVISLLQDALSYFSDSKYVPFGMAALGKSYMEIESNAEAQGYFKIILDRYKKFVGIPEVLFHLGLLELEKKRQKQAISIFKRIVSKYPDSQFVAKAKYEMGKALYAINNFTQALRMLNDVAESNPLLLYETQELLYNIGDSYYHTGKYDKAREALGKAYNFFPKNEGNDKILTRIGDTFLDEKDIEKAKKIFQLVIELYPGTDGYVISSMRLAEHLETREEKETIYTRIINEYPDNPMANLAMLRMAGLEQKDGEYARSIKTIQELLLQRSRTLRKEALFLMEESVIALFKQQMTESEYPLILSFYEKEKRMIDAFENAELSFFIGKAYFKGHLYKQALAMFKKSRHYYANTDPPDELSYFLGAALYETGDSDNALKELIVFSRKFPNGSNIADTYHHIGKIYMDKKMYQHAIDQFRIAFNKSAAGDDRSEILLSEAKAYAGKGDFKQCSFRLIQAIDLLSTTAGKNALSISSAFRNLGDSYQQLGSYKRASEAYSSALKYALESDRNKAYLDLRFKLAESYQKERMMKKAIDTYNDVIASGDPFWGKLAEEKVNGIRIEKKLD